MDIKELISEKIEIPQEVITDVAKITIIGTKEVFVENYTELIECKEKSISLKYKKGMIEISGDGLKIRAIGEKNIAIFGEVANVRLV